jgi:outer membrane receptor protein involved in Fe transport
MSFVRTLVLAALLTAAGASAARAASIAGTATDPSGTPVASARVTLTNLATGAEATAEADAEGRFRFDGLPIGIYRVAVARESFSEDARTISVADANETLEVSFILRPGGLTAGVTVTATRSERDALQVPLRTETLTRADVEQRAPLATGDALLEAASVTPVGSGPYGTRPRLRGLDSTRLLVLVDGERLNNARSATDRAGTEVGLVDLSSVESLEVVSGAGSVLYGTDALAGTINIITTQPAFSDGLKVTYGLDGLYSANENGHRGTAMFGVSNRRVAVNVLATLESYENYTAGKSGRHESTQSYYDSGQVTQEDTIDDAFGFDFNAFPDPFNAPYTRTSSEIRQSTAKGSNLNVSGLVALTENQTLRLKYIRRRMEDIGFPDFEPPVFFQRVTLPQSAFDRASLRYEARAIAPWLPNLKASVYYQDQDRTLRNQFPVQFPVPSPRFFPISVFRLNILSDTRQHVRTPGLDVQATLLPAKHHVLTAGMTIYRDDSRDSRFTSTETTIIGNVTLGSRGPQANVFAAPQVLGPPATSNPVRVPDSTFRDVGVFAQDEWDITRHVRLVAGLRLDGYAVTTKNTPGYDVDSLVAGAVPPIPPDSLPNESGDSVSRTAVTGDLGVVVRPNDRWSVVAHYGRSYRHPNLEEMLFAGPATVGAIAPNLKVGPETGHNVDVGVKVRTTRYAGSLAYFNNTYDGFISTEIVAEAAGDPLTQAINFVDVRIQGVEANGEVPVALRKGTLTLFGTAAYTRGVILSGANPLTGISLAGTPQDNISPFKTILGARFADASDRFWVEYGVRAQARVRRVATTLLESPFIIPQDLLGLDGFAVQRLAWGVNLRRDDGRVGLTFALENIGDRFYREQFQFAPARGRAFTVGLHVRGE